MSKEKKLSIKHHLKKLKGLMGMDGDYLYTRITYDRKSTIIRSYSESSMSGGVWPKSHEANDKRLINELFQYYCSKYGLDNFDINRFNTKGNEETKYLLEECWLIADNFREKKLIEELRSLGLEKIFKMIPSTDGVDELLEALHPVNPELIEKIIDNVRVETAVANLLFAPISSGKPIAEHFDHNPQKFSWNHEDINFIARIDFEFDEIPNLLINELKTKGIVLNKKQLKDICCN